MSTPYIEIRFTRILGDPPLDSGISMADWEAMNKKATEMHIPLHLVGEGFLHSWLRGDLALSNHLNEDSIPDLEPIEPVEGVCDGRR